MYKNPIFGDIIPQKTINSYSNIIFFQNSLKYSKYASISPTIFLQKIHPHLPVSPSSCYGSVENYWEIDCALLPNREWNQKQKPKKQHQISQKRFCMVGTRYFESTEKVLFFKDQNEKCLRFITFLSINRLNKAMIGRKRRVKRLFLRY